MHLLNNERTIYVLICLCVLTNTASSYAFPHGEGIYLDREPYILVITTHTEKMNSAYRNIGLLNWLRNISTVFCCKELLIFKSSVLETAVVEVHILPNTASVAWLLSAPPNSPNQHLHFISIFQYKNALHCTQHNIIISTVQHIVVPLALSPKLK